MRATKIIVFLLAILLLASCSVEKRYYMQGYNINWNKKSNFITESTSDTLYIPSFASINTPTETTSMSDSCDIIYSKSGDTIRVKILELSPTNIKYFRIDDENELVREVQNVNIKKIFFDGESIDNDSLKRIKIKITTNTKSKNDIVQLRTERILGKVTEINKNTIKYTRSDDPQKKEIKISVRTIRKITLGNGEHISKKELKKLKNKISTRENILSYSETEDFKINKIKILNKYAIIYSCFFFLPVIGAPTDIIALRHTYLAEKYIDENPELVKYMFLTELAKALAIIGVVLSAIVGFFLFLLIAA